MEYCPSHDPDPVFLQAIPWTLLLVFDHHILGPEHPRNRFPNEMGGTKRAMAILTSLG